MIGRDAPDLADPSMPKNRKFPPLVALIATLTLAAIFGQVSAHGTNPAAVSALAPSELEASRGALIPLRLATVTIEGVTGESKDKKPQVRRHKRTPPHHHVARGAPTTGSVSVVSQLSVNLG
ncbi:MAG TPA: hypothetical protein VN806_10585 [Caulobacteraceae bacterium]|nr:hypothetical protein [Caulobacteraceae bacterium]